MSKAKRKSVVLVGAYYLRDRFVSQSHIKTALEATGKQVLVRPPKDADDVLIVTGKTLGKRDKSQLHLVAEKRGIPIEELDDMVNARFMTALAKSMRAGNKLLPSESRLLEELDNKKTA